MQLGQVGWLLCFSYGRGSEVGRLSFAVKAYLHFGTSDELRPFSVRSLSLPSRCNGNLF